MACNVKRLTHPAAWIASGCGWFRALAMLSGNVVNGNDPVGERQEDEQMIPNAKKLRRSITVSG